jgi:F420-dependent oxidoreductase-like protein
MRLGCSLGTRALTPEDFVTTACKAEQLGYDSVWSSEFHATDPLPLLGLIAGKTSTIALGTAVMQITGRTPVTAASGAAVMDRISGGRFRLGLGTSGPQVVEGWHGQAFDRPLARTRDYLAVVRMALAGEPISYHGETLTLPLPGGEAVQKAALPVHEPLRIPLYLAGLGPRSIAMVGEIADGWLAIHSPPSYIAEGRGRLSAGADRAGRSLDRFDVAVMVLVFIEEDLELARDTARPTLAQYIGGMGTSRTNFYNRLAGRLGYEAEAAQVQKAFLAGRVHEAITNLPDGLVDEMAICGPPALVRDRLAAYRDAGTDTLIAGLPRMSSRRRQEQLEHLAALGATL